MSTKLDGAEQSLVHLHQLIQAKAQSEDPWSPLTLPELFQLCRWEIYGSYCMWCVLKPDYWPFESQNRLYLAMLPAINVASWINDVGSLTVYSVFECCYKSRRRRLDEIRGLACARMRCLPPGPHIGQMAYNKRQRRIKHQDIMTNWVIPKPEQRRQTVREMLVRTSSHLRRLLHRNEAEIEAQMQSRLFQLPAELRELIWRFLVVDSKPFDLVTKETTWQAAGFGMRPVYTPLRRWVDLVQDWPPERRQQCIQPLAQTCRRIYVEVAPLVYRETTFSAGSIYSLFRLSRMISPQHACLIRRIELYRTQIADNDLEPFLRRSNQQTKDFHNAFRHFHGLRFIKLVQWLAWDADLRAYHPREWAPMRQIEMKSGVKPDLSLDLWMPLRSESDLDDTPQKVIELFWWWKFQRCDKIHDTNETEKDPP